MEGTDPLTASVLDSAREAALLLDGDRRVVHPNAAAVRLLRREADILAGTLLELPVPPTSAEGRWAPLDGSWPGGDELEALSSLVGVEPERVVVWLRARTAGRPGDEVLLDEVEALAGVGRWVIRPGGRTDWSPGFHRLLGLRPGDVEPSPERVLEATHPLDVARVAAVVRELDRRGDMPPLRFRIVWPDGSVRTLAATQLVADHDDAGRPTRVEGWAQDVTRQAAEDRLRRAAADARTALRRWRGLEDAPALLAAVGGALEVAFAILWVPREGHLQAVGTWSAPGFDPGDLEEAVRRSRIASGTGFAGRAWASGTPVVAEDVPAPERTWVAGRAGAAGLSGGCAVPARTDGHVAAVLTLHTCHADELTPSDVAQLGWIGDALGREVARASSTRREALSPRELEVLRAIAAGRATADIAEDLGISTATVRTHVEHLLAKLGARDRAAAVASAMRAGMID